MRRPRNSAVPPKADTVRGHVARALRQFRERRGLSLPDVALATGLSPAVLGSYESALRPIGAGTLFELAVALEVPVAAFFAGLSAPMPSGEAEELLDSGEDLVALLLRIDDPKLLQRLGALLRHLAKPPQPASTR